MQLSFAHPACYGARSTFRVSNRSEWRRLALLRGNDPRQRGCISARRSAKGNEKKAAAAAAAARTLLNIAWAVMAAVAPAPGKAEDVYGRREHRNREHLVARHQQALRRLGYQVTLTRLGYQVTLTPIDTPPPDPDTPADGRPPDSHQHRQAEKSRLRLRCRAMAGIPKFPHRG